MGTTLFMLGCSVPQHVDVDQYEVDHYQSEVQKDDFTFRLISEKEQYKELEPIQLYGEIIYTGDQEEIEIVHSDSAISFHLFEEIRQYNIDETIQDIGVFTTLKRNEPYRKRYDKQNIYKTDSSNRYVHFIKQFIDQDGFPVGYYTIKGFANFTVSEDDNNENMTPYQMETQIDFKVVE